MSVNHFTTYVLCAIELLGGGTTLQKTVFYCKVQN